MPFAYPSQSLGTQMNPSDRAREETSPDLLWTGAANTLPPDSLRLTPIYTVRPWFAGTASESRAFKGLMVSMVPVSFDTSAFTKRVDTKKLAPGWPGRPTMGLLELHPSMVGLPGFMAMP